MMPLENETRSDKICVEDGALCGLFEQARLRALKTTLKLEIVIVELKSRRASRRSGSNQRRPADACTEPAHGTIA
jgi:hypothetical protein